MVEKEKLGIKESKELMGAMMSLSICLLEVFRDGVQISDALDLWNKIGKDEKMKASFILAFENYKMVPKELADLDVSETVDLLQCVLMKMPEIINSLKKPEQKKI